MTGVHSKVATIMKETELGTRCGRRTMYVSCRFIASGSISVMRYNNNNPLSSKTTAQLLRKPSEPPYLQPLASEKMKSGTRSFFTASPPPPHLVQSSLRLKSSTQAPTSHALPDGSPQKPNVRTKQLLLWSSPLPAKTPQKKPSAEASHYLGRSSKSNATCPFALDSVAVTTTAKEKSTPNISPSLYLIGQQPFLTASSPHFTH